MSVRTAVGIAVLLAGFVAPAAPSRAVLARQTSAIDLALAPALRWRPIGPAIAGRITAIDGLAGRPGAFYAAAAGGGLWKTTDFGASWQPAFDAPPAGTISTVAVSPSRPDVVFASAVGLAGSRAGDTLHKTVDDGRTWQPVGQPAGGTITSIALDPRGTDTVLMAVAGSAAPAGHGVFRSIDGGLTFARVLDVRGDDTTLVVHPTRPDVVFVAASAPTDDAAGARLYLSADDGVTWRPVLDGIGARGTGTGTVRLSLAAAPDSTQTFLLVGHGADTAALYRSDDFAETWTPVNDRIPIDAGARPRIDIAPGGRLYLAGNGLWESADGGATFTPVEGVPRDRGISLLWPHPSMRGVLAAAGREGVIVTVNGGKTWSQPSGPPSADLSRVVADTAFPYRVCATLASNTACAVHRAGEGRSAAWQRLPASVGVVTPDPLDPDVVFSGAAVRYDRRTQQAIDIGWAPVAGLPEPHAVLAFASDNRTLYAGSRAVWRSTNGGLAWTQASPDLATGSDDARIAALTISPVDARTIWAGQNDGRVHLTRDAGTTWAEVTRPSASPGAVIRSLEPSRFDSRSAYVVVAGEDASRTGSTRLLRTRDAGASWVDIGAALGEVGAIHVVREDALRRGLLFAGTDLSVFMSFDDGDLWQPLRLNLPPSAVRDLTIRDADLIAATGGRGVWILDDLSPLRQLTADVARADAFLFRPTQTWRVRATALDEGPDAAGDSAARFTYLIGGANEDAVTIDVIETATGDVLRRFSSRPDPDRGQIALPSGPGLHRVSWDLRYPPPVTRHPGSAPGTRVLPGVYQVRLTVGGRAIRQALSIRMDPRVRTPLVDLTAQRDLGRALDAARAALEDAISAATFASAPSDAPPAAPAALLDELDRLARVLQQADARPTARIETAIEEAIDRVTRRIGSGL